jgi:hypothetical protein
MLKREFSDILKQTALFGLAALLLPAIMIVLRFFPGQPYIFLFFPVFQAALLFWALFLGASLLGPERGQGGLEYALSLPATRLQLLAWKVIPRLAVLGGLYAVMAVLFRLHGDNYAALSLEAFSLLYISLFWISLSLAPSFDNFLVACLVSLFVWAVAFEALLAAAWLGVAVQDIPQRWLPTLARPLEFLSASRELLSPAAVWGAAILILGPFAVALTSAFKKFDVRPARAYNRRFLKIFAPAAVAGLACAGVVAHLGIRQYEPDRYLTRNLKLLECNPFSARLRDADRIQTIGSFPSLGWPLLESEHFIYFYGDDESLFRLDTATARVEPFYKSPQKSPGWWRLCEYDSTIALIETGAAGDEIRLVLIDQTTRASSPIAFRHSLLSGDSKKRRFLPFLFGTGVREGKRFWLAHLVEADKHLLRLWDDGRVDDIAPKDAGPVRRVRYVNNLLFLSGKNGTAIYQDRGASFELVKRISSGFEPALMFPPPRKLDTAPARFLYAKRGDRIVQLDLETLAVEDLGPWVKTPGDSWGFVVVSDSNAGYFIGGERSARSLAVDALSEGRRTRLRTFEGFDTSRRDTRFEVFEAGIVVTIGKSVRAYAFPDLREIRLKGLS